MKLQSEELQVHAEELSKVWHQLDEEKEARVTLEKQLLTLTDSQQKVITYLYTVSARW